MVTTALAFGPKNFSRCISAPEIISKIRADFIPRIAARGNSESQRAGLLELVDGSQGMQKPDFALD